MARSIGVRGSAMKHEIRLFSPLFGSAVLVVLSWIANGPCASYIQFAQPMTRAEVSQHGSDLMAWFSSLASESPSALPFSWCVVDSDLEFLPW